MNGLRWLEPPEETGEDATRIGPPVGSFIREANGQMRVQPTRAPAMPPRIFGTDPEFEHYHPYRDRNRANSGVYTLRPHSEGSRGGARVRVPLVGEIAAGDYRVSIALYDHRDWEEGVEVERALAQVGSGAFALRVRGTSMTHVGIEPGDLVIVRPQDYADNGDFVVARLADSTDPEGYVTLKRFYRRQDHIFLQSATADKDPIRLFPQVGALGRPDRDQVKVQGKVVAVVKHQA